MEKESSPSLIGILFPGTRNFFLTLIARERLQKKLIFSKRFEIGKIKKKRNFFLWRNEILANGTRQLIFFQFFVHLKILVEVPVEFRGQGRMMHQLEIKG